MVAAGTRTRNPVAAWSSIAAGNVKDFARLPDAERNVRRPVGVPTPGVLHKVINLNGLYNVTVRKRLKTKGSRFRVSEIVGPSGSFAKNPIHTK
jgi:hypothetical protein